MSRHHHHYYDETDAPAILAHDHEYENLRHVVPELGSGKAIYWDHEGDDCTADDPEHPVNEAINRASKDTDE
jgi:hypothetical protein